MMIGKFRINKGMVSVFVLSLMLAMFSMASENESINDAEEMQKMVEPANTDMALSIQQAIDDYFDAMGVNEGEVRDGGKVYYSDITSANLKINHPQWVKSRALAFEKSLLNIQTKFVSDTFSTLTHNREQAIFKDDSTNARQFDKEPVSVSRIQSLLNKTVALGEAKLNQLLLDAGIDPAEYAAVPSEKRKDFFTEQYVSKSLEQAVGAVTGLMLVQTFAGEDADGTTTIGLVAMHSSKLQQLAYDIANSIPPLMTSKNGKPIKQYTDLSPEQLSNMFGVRVVFDEAGAPWLLSYGQWGYSYQGNDNQVRISNRKLAQEQADTIAKEGLANFINNTLNLKNEVERGELKKNSMVKQGDVLTEESVSELIDKMTKSVKARSQVNLSGTRIVKRWVYKATDTQEVVGVVRAWSYAGAQNAKQVLEFKPQNHTRQGNGIQNPNVKPKNSGKVQAGASFLDDDEDF